MTLGALAQTTVTLDFTGDSAYGMTLLSGSASTYNDNPYVCTEGDVTLTLNGNTRWWKATGGNQLRFYKGSSMAIAVPDGNVITSVVFTTKAASSFTATEGTYADGTWTGSLATVNISCNISKGNAAISSIAVTYQSSSAAVKKSANLAFSASTATATLGEAFTAPTLTKETTASVTYSSSNPDVATVDAQTGAVTIVAVGTTTITAKSEENDEYNAGNASYTLSVTTSIVYDNYTETFATGIGSFTIENVSLGDLSYVWKHDASYKYMKASAYANSTNNAAESWLVSPWISLSSASMTRTLTFDQTINKYFGTIANEATLWIKEQGGDWKQLTITYPEIADGKNWSSAETQTLSLKEYEGKTFKIGFKYVSTAEASGTWEIANFAVTSTEGAGISTVKAATLDANAPVYNLAGQRVNKNTKGILIQNGKKFINK